MNNAKSSRQNVLEILVYKVTLADAKLKGLVKSQAPKLDYNSLYGKTLLKRERASYMIQKRSLDEAINEIESWQRLSFNPI